MMNSFWMQSSSILTSVLTVVLCLATGVQSTQAQSGNASDVTGPILTTGDGAQSPAGNSSNVTGPILTTSDVVNQPFQRQPGAPGSIVFADQASVTPVNQAAVGINTDLSAGTLTVSGGAVPTATQQTVLSLLASTQADSSASSQIVSALSQAQPGTEASVQTLVARLQGLSSGCSTLDQVNQGCRVSPDQLARAVIAFNALVDNSSPAFLTNSPPEFLTIRAVLARLVDAASTTSVQ